MKRGQHLELVSILKDITIYPIMGRDSNAAKFIDIDLSQSNKALSQSIDYEILSDYVNHTINSAKTGYAIGGYLEHRNLYGSSGHFSQEEKRDIHLGIDIWTAADHPIFAPIDGIIHSYAYNDKDLDYGYTLILKHQMDSLKFYTLYGHLSSEHYEMWQRGKTVSQGDIIATLGDKYENGGWPPHLHFQIILDIGEWTGDYPGVSSKEQLDYYDKNCPDPSCLIN